MKKSPDFWKNLSILRSILTFLSMFGIIVILTANYSASPNLRCMTASSNVEYPSEIMASLSFCTSACLGMTFSNISMVSRSTSSISPLVTFSRNASELS